MADSVSAISIQIALSRHSLGSRERDFESLWADVSALARRQAGRDLGSGPVKLLADVAVGPTAVHAAGVGTK
jgi:hypothetical protein